MLRETKLSLFTMLIAVAALGCAKNETTPANSGTSTARSATGSGTSQDDVVAASTGDCSWLVGNWECSSSESRAKRFFSITEIEGESQTLKIGMGTGAPPAAASDFRTYPLDGEWRTFDTETGREARRRGVCSPRKLEIFTEVSDARDNPAMVTTFQQSAHDQMQLWVAPEGETNDPMIVPVTCSRR